MAARQANEGVMMSDLIADLLDGLDEEYGLYIHPNDFNRLLENYDLMVVPIEDPTNLRYGADD